MADCMALLLAGNIITAITCTWTNVISFWFYAIMIFNLAVLVFIRTDSVLSAVTLGSLLTSLMIPVLPPIVQGLTVIILSVIAASVFYMVLLRD